MSDVNISSNYRPSEKEKFMGPKQQEFFRRQLLGWRDDIVRDAKDTIQNLQEDDGQAPDIADRATTESARSIELPPRDRQRKPAATIDAPPPRTASRPSASRPPPAPSRPHARPSRFPPAVDGHPLRFRRARSSATSPWDVPAPPGPRLRR